MYYLQMGSGPSSETISVSNHAPKPIYLVDEGWNITNTIPYNNVLLLRSVSGVNLRCGKSMIRCNISSNNMISCNGYIIQVDTHKLTIQVHLSYKNILDKYVTNISPFNSAINVPNMLYPSSESIIQYSPIVRWINRSDTPVTVFHHYNAGNTAIALSLPPSSVTLHLTNYSSLITIYNIEISIHKSIRSNGYIFYYDENKGDKIGYTCTVLRDPKYRAHIVNKSQQTYTIVTTRDIHIPLLPGDDIFIEGVKDILSHSKESIKYLDEITIGEISTRTYHVILFHPDSKSTSVTILR
jgi:hypothetical protein